jgi:hypothetical protein
VKPSPHLIFLIEEFSKKLINVGDIIFFLSLFNSPLQFSPKPYNSPLSKNLVIYLL